MHMIFGRAWRPGATMAAIVLFSSPCAAAPASATPSAAIEASRSQPELQPGMLISDEAGAAFGRVERVTGGRLTILVGNSRITVPQNALRNGAAPASLVVAVQTVLGVSSAQARRAAAAGSAESGGDE